MNSYDGNAASLLNLAFGFAYITTSDEIDDQHAAFRQADADRMLKQQITITERISYDATSDH
jgi:hypothetical protein